MTQVTDEQVRKEGAAALNALLKKVNKENPAPADLAQISSLLEQLPNIAMALGDLSNQAELRILEGAFKNDRGYMLMVSKRMEIMRQEMGYAMASAIERSLIEHIILCWLRLYTTELRYESNIKDATLAQGAYWERKLSEHQKRYLRAVETLARIRKLNINVQLNIAGKQVIQNGRS